MDIITDHGQKIYIAEPNEIDETVEYVVARQRELERIVHSNYNYSGSYFYEFGEECKKYANEGIHFGYYFWNNDEEKGPIIDIAMYKKDLGYQRVQFENSKCLNCGSWWRIANPSWLVMYPKYDFDISELEYPLLGCPKCGGKIDRNAIWIGEELDRRLYRRPGDPKNNYAEIEKSDD
ncbi:MAG: hypothetical protein K2N72_03035 [Oscillospiraceae bacterium]|nr:hypothetical protein [Oscillospiraceae bacterium]